VLALEEQRPALSLVERVLELELAPDRAKRYMRVQRWREVAEYLADTESCLADMGVHNLVLVKEVCCNFDGMDPQEKIDMEHQYGDVVVDLRRHTCHLRSELADIEEAVYLPPILGVILGSTQHRIVAGWMDVEKAVCPVVPLVQNKNETDDADVGVQVVQSGSLAKAEVVLAEDDTLDEDRLRVLWAGVVVLVEAVCGYEVDTPDKKEGGSLGESASQSWPEKTMLKLLSMSGMSTAVLVAVTCVITTSEM
jgi:hypothetical protein